jgi:hypothetical protein
MRPHLRVNIGRPSGTRIGFGFHVETGHRCGHQQLGLE